MDDRILFSSNIPVFVCGLVDPLFVSALGNNERLLKKKQNEKRFFVKVRILKAVFFAKISCPYSFENKRAT
ncbi:hypothetical protein BUQ74_08060 [Leptospira weilii serovar Heyan]|uniref:Uncharacterized protein n=1 Tax=Leptospira weilii str. UI 13098 TaxID=1088542 RepID=M6QDM1_9LEPT|nr:hypothetical protein LEP1GSC051_1361 [Leptospira sp. P2653]EMN90688.1 hypothetical protein LEP1GSC108_2281 [Leptospira weilii str. UI 13098]OMI17882.1 hypothetical protein BUQ74_08060 [Leptospira weilii serovar Heyan]